MKTCKYILLSALWLINVSSKGRELCNRTEVKAPLGSSVSLPCTISSNGSNWVKWSHKYEKDEAGVELVDLSSKGLINFLDPRSGRVKIFPNQFSEMNYGIIIDELKDSDMGSYYCKQNNECFEVKLFEDEGEQFSEETCGKDFCETYQIPATLGSSVLLPCNFDTGAFKWVTWVHLEKGDMVRLSSEGRVDFQNPRSGRVKAFPNQALDGNYSTVIDELKSSDLGSYCCKQRSNCLRVELLGGKSTLSPAMQLLIYSSGGVAALILISLFGYYCWIKFKQGEINGSTA
ncbi:PREDICTED: uncharacterized protein LOC107083456 isoform X2 [Cyprinodon variegatus]|uniref:uncharacterized protein LOC107083456 isoform X2 n=1 Tax=Cyprinodon variegatus TaxID=28743 RepID=UPI0007429EF9|nr:PREDICTED: uncharacterized protein LOC107083456 isoform X2 [Cyprinodon variegatus]